MKNRQVNLYCRSCGLSLDTDILEIVPECPICGEKLWIRVETANDILDERVDGELSRIRFTRDVKLEQKKTDRKWSVNCKAMVAAVFVLFAALLIAAVLLARLGYLS